MVPLAGCVPTPLSIETPVALVVLQESIDCPPTLIEAGLAVKLTTWGGGGFTVTVTEEPCAICVAPS